MDIKLLKQQERERMPSLNGHDFYRIYHRPLQRWCYAKIVQKELEEGTSRKDIDDVLRCCLSRGDFQKFKRNETKDIYALKIDLINYGKAKELFKRRYGPS